MPNDRRLLLALLDWNDAEEINLGYTRDEQQVAIRLVGYVHHVRKYVLRVGNDTTEYASLDSLEEVLIQIGMI